MVTVKYGKKEIEVKEGTLLSDAIRLMEERVETPCNCMGICKKCRVEVRGSLSPREEIEEELPVGRRLACIARVVGDTEVFRLKEGELKVSEEDMEFHINTEDVGRVLAIDVGTTGVSAR